MRNPSPIPLRIRDAIGVALLALVVSTPLARAMPPARDGHVPAPLAEATEAGVFSLPLRAELATSVGENSWFIPVILVGFTDSTLTHSHTEFTSALFDTTRSTATGSVPDYFEWVSRGRLKPRFEVVATVQLGQGLNYYANDRYGVDYLATPRNDWGLVRDAIEAADPVVDWTRFDRDGDSYVDMVWVIHAGIGGEATTNRRSLWSITSRMSAGWSGGSAIETDEFVPGSDRQHMRVDRFSILPERSSFRPGEISEIGVYCHEFGHALGLPDLYDTSQLGGGANVGPGNWSLMSTGAYGGDGHSPQFPSALGAWPMLYLGWAERIRPSRDTTMVLAPVTEGGPVVEYWYQGESNPEHFLLEARTTTSFDRNLFAPGLLISQVDDALIGLLIGANRINTGPKPGLRILEADGDFDMNAGRNHGDPSDPLPGALGKVVLNDTSSPSLRTFAGAFTDLEISDIALEPNGVRASLRVRSPGWSEPLGVVDPEWSPVNGGGRGRMAACTPQGVESIVGSDSRSGTPQVWLRTRDLGGEWLAPESVTQSSVAAFEPAISLLPGDDLAIAWTDLRDGQFQIWYRSRISGHWTPERRLTNAPEGCVSPAIATDAHGRVFVAWVRLRSPRPSLECLVFSWASPWGTPTTITDSLARPTAPALGVTPEGRAMLVWSDLAGALPLLMFSRWSPDSGVGPPLRLTSSVIYSQPAGDVIGSAEGGFHIAWQQQGSGASELRYMHRPWDGRNTIRDTLLVNSADPLQSPLLATDAAGGVHLVFERTTPGGQQLQYKHWTASRGWDWGEATLSDPSESVAHGLLSAITPGNVNVTWHSSDGVVNRLATRLRRLDGGSVVSVPEPARIASGFHLAPSPVRAGTALRMSGPGMSPHALVDLIDAAGRRVASARTDITGTASFDASVTARLSPGLYFARSRVGDPEGTHATPNARVTARVVVLR